MVEQLAGEHKDVKFLGLNAHENQETSAQFGIFGLPTLIFFKGGKEVTRLVGALPKPKIEAELQKIKG